MINVSARASCGCCNVDLCFTDEASAEAAFVKAGYGSSKTIIDDTGEEIHGVDTFYGFSVEGENTNGLEYLAAQVLSKNS